MSENVKVFELKEEDTTEVFMAEVPDMEKPNLVEETPAEPMTAAPTAVVEPTAEPNPIVPMGEVAKAEDFTADSAFPQESVPPSGQLPEVPTEETPAVAAEVDKVATNGNTNGDAVHNGNGSSCEAHVDQDRLASLGFDQAVFQLVLQIFQAGILKFDDLDERAIDALKSTKPEHSMVVLSQFKDANLSHVSNKASFLCSLIKSYKEKIRTLGPQLAMSTPLFAGPDEGKIKTILERTGYSLEVSIGQRKYGGPPPNWEGGPPVGPCEVYVGKIPKEVYEDELIPLFEECGTIWDLRLMMDPMTSQNKGYAFVTYTTRDAAQKAAKKYDDFELKKGKRLKVNVSIANTRLFVGNIPKSKSKAEILEEFCKFTDGITEVIVYAAPDDPMRKKNRGFCFLQYDEHKNASSAKKKLSSGRVKPWNCELVVDWAEQQEEPDDEIMSKVKVLYVKNLRPEVTEDGLKVEFEQFGEVERVKKVKDYAFIHFKERDEALKAMDTLNGKEFEGSHMEISLAKPQTDRSTRDKQRIDRERRQGQFARSPFGDPFMPQPSPFGRTPPPLGMRGRPRGGSFAPPPPPVDYGYDYGYGGGYDGYGSGYNEPFYDDWSYGGSGGGPAGYDDYYGGGPSGYGGGRQSGGYGGGGYNDMRQPLPPPRRPMRSSGGPRQSGGGMGGGGGMGQRGRGSGGAPMLMSMRSGGGGNRPPPMGGGRGSARGVFPQRSGGNRGGGGGMGQMAPRGGMKRKLMSAEPFGEPKRQNLMDHSDGWSQPISQQPLEPNYADDLY